MGNTIRTLIAEIEITETGIFPPVPAWAVEDYFQRLVDPGGPTDGDPWAPTRFWAFESLDDYIAGRRTPGRDPGDPRRAGGVAGQKRGPSQ